MEIDASRWSGDGDFTRVLLAKLRQQPEISGLRIEDAPASRDDVGYSFISNELFVVANRTEHHDVAFRWGVWPIRRSTSVLAITLPDIAALLAADPAIGAPDVSDESMLQYLRTQRIVPAYQTRGYKLVELIRIYMAGTEPTR